MIFARTRNQYLADQHAKQRRPKLAKATRPRRSRRSPSRFDYAIGKEGVLFARGNVLAFTKSEARSVIKRRYNAKSTAGIVEWVNPK